MCGDERWEAMDLSGWLLCTAWCGPLLVAQQLHGHSTIQGWKQDEVEAQRKLQKVTSISSLSPCDTFLLLIIISFLGIGNQISFGSLSLMPFWTSRIATTNQIWTTSSKHLRSISWAAAKGSLSGPSSASRVSCCMKINPRPALEKGRWELGLGPRTNRERGQKHASGRNLGLFIIRSLIFG